MTDSARYAQQPGESPKAFAAFAAYRDLGPARSIVKALDAAGGPTANLRQRKRQWEVWSKWHRWVERAQEWDKENDRIRQVENREAIKKAARRHAQLAMLAQSKGMDALQKVKADDLSPRDAWALIERGVVVERTALGIESEARDKEAPPPDDADELLPDAAGGARLTGFLNAARARKEAGQPPDLPAQDTAGLEDLSEPPPET